MDDWLKVIATAAGWLNVPGLRGKALFRWTRAAQARISHSLMVLFIAHRTYVPWDRVIRQQERKYADGYMLATARSYRGKNSRICARNFSRQKDS